MVLSPDLSMSRLRRVHRVEQVGQLAPRDLTGRQLAGVGLAHEREPGLLHVGVSWQPVSASAVTQATCSEFCR